MTGTILNILAVLIGGSLGTLVGARLPARVQESVIWILGLFVIALGVKLTLKITKCADHIGQRPIRRPLRRVVEPRQSVAAAGHVARGALCAQQQQ